MRDARCCKGIGQPSQRGLPGAQHHAIGGDQFGGFAGRAVADMQAGSVDPFVIHPAQHPHPLHLQRRPMNPAGGFAQTPPRPFRLALQQRDRAGCGLWLRPGRGQTTPGFRRITHPPFAPPQVGIIGRKRAGMGQKLRNVKTDAACADHRHPRTRHFGAAQHLDIAQHLRAILPRYVRVARLHPGGHNHRIKPGEVGGIHPAPQPHRHPAFDQHGLIPADQAVKLLFPRHHLGKVQLPAHFTCRLEQRDKVPTLRRHQRR